jgi:uncharacterized protein (DUF1800 family)
MPSKLAELTPQTAWLPLEATAAFDRRMAAHLFRRAGFAAPARELNEAVSAGLLATVKQLLTAGERSRAFDEEMRQFAEVALAAGNPQSLAGWWLHRLRHTPAPLVEKLTLFWHSHFATSAAKVKDARLLYEQNELFRRYALGKFAPLVQGIARDPAMLLYLDSATNRKNHPNENFAREVMELFCLGLGRYSERDIRELARCFTGWEILHEQFTFNSYQHDYGTKSLLGKSGTFGGDEGLRVILQQPACAEFLCGKLVRFFVTDEELPAEWIAPLARRFRDGDLAIAPVLETIFTSRLFYSERAVGQLVRSPVELGIGLLRALEMNTNLIQLAERLRELGQLVFFPPNVKGWPGGKNWIDSSTLLGRANLVRSLAGNLPPSFLSERTSAEQVDQLLELLLAVPPPAEVRTTLIEQLEQAGGRPTAVPQVVSVLGALPEFQLS